MWDDFFAFFISSLSLVFSDCFTLNLSQLNRTGQHFIPLFLQEFAKQKLLEASKPESKEKVLQIEEPVQKSLEDISAIQQVLEVIKSLYQLAEDISETVSLSGSYLH